MPLRKTDMDTTEPQKNAAQTFAAEFLRQYRLSGNYLREHIAALARLASSDNADDVKAATGAIFASLVEALADSFEPQAVTLYNRVFAQLIDFCRKTEQGERFDRELANFGLEREEDFIARAERLRHIRRLQQCAEEKRRIKRAIVLSRVTLGADVAVTSIVIERLKTEFPNAEIVLVGGSKAVELFGGDARLRFNEIQYQRAGTLTERLLSWLEVLRSVRQLLAGLSEEEYFIADPDSRLTQLGLLPLVAEPDYDNPKTISPKSRPQIFDNYLFFPSRELGNRTSHSISELTSVWLNAVFDGDEKTLPCLRLKASDKDLAKALIRRMRQQDGRPIVAINFGIGENLCKRVSDGFEKQLVTRLLENGVKIIFDKGFGDGEIERANAVLAEAERLTYENRKLKILEIDETNLPTLLNGKPPETKANQAIAANANLTDAIATDALAADVLVWQGRIGLLAALIGESNLYIGYDSAGQHIAAALGVPCVDVFAGYSSPRMLERWRPTGKADSQVIAVDTSQGEMDDAAIIRQTLQQAVLLLENGKRFL
jgi:ADP-heptose:LPS heptosyltransferase